MLSEKDLKKTGRGTFDWKVGADSGAVLVPWLDRRAVNCVSNYVGVDPIGTCRRWSEKDKQKVDVPQPAIIIKEYNQFMGGVDLIDMLIQLYRIRQKCKRGYLRVIH